MGDGDEGHSISRTMFKARSSIRDPQSSIRNRLSSILNLRPSILNLRSSILHSQSSILCLVFLAALLVYSQNQFWKQPSSGDRANWDYFAQVIVRGGVPYKDVVNIKSPLSAYIGAVAIVVTKPFGLRDIFAIRIAFLILSALVAAFTFQLASEYLDSRVGIIAATVMISCVAFSRYNSGGIQPKTPMILFGLLSLLALKRDRPFLSGLFGMCSALCWQPGLLFVGVAFLGFSRYLTNWRDGKLMRLLSGSLLPLIVLILYFWAAGALKSFYLWNVDFPLTVYAPHEARTVSNFFSHLLKLVNGPYKNTRPYFYIALGGLLIAILQEAIRILRSPKGQFASAATSHALIISLLVYFGFCMIDIQGGPDLIPLLPFVATFSAFAILFVVDQCAKLWQRVKPGLNRGLFDRYAVLVIVVFMIYSDVTVAFYFERAFPTLADQEAAVQELMRSFRPGDSIFTYGQTELLVLTGMTNASKYFLLDRGKAGYLDQVEPGGFNGWLEELKRQRPRIVAMERLMNDNDLKPLEEWVAEDYRPASNRVFTCYVRKGD